MLMYYVAYKPVLFIILFLNNPLNFIKYLLSKTVIFLFGHTQYLYYEFLITSPMENSRHKHRI